MSQQAFEQLFTREYERGYEAGKQDATTIHLDEHLGTTTQVTVVTAMTRRALSRAVKELDRGHIDTGCGYDCSGRLCGQYAKMLRAYRLHYSGEDKWCAIVEVTQSFDV